MLAKLQSKLTTRCLGFTKAVAACCLLGIAANAFADRNPNPGVLPAGSNPYGMSYGNWGAAWWAWGLSVGKDQNPITDPDGSFCDVNQSGPVWFLAGSFGGENVRTCVVPRGKALFFPISNNVYWAPEDLEFVISVVAPSLGVDTTGMSDEEILRFGVNWATSHTTSLSVNIDGVEVIDPWQYRGQSDAFTLELSDVLEDFGYPPGPRTPSVADGYWIMLSPLKPGPHTIHFTATGSYSTANGDPFDSEFALDMTYHLTVE